jgi:solute carrier family 25 carnitine/acylcarnitine transporter 20/29
MSTTAQAMWAGSIAGAASLSIFVPMDLLKIRAQLTREGKLDYLSECRAILREQGVRGLYRGFWASAARDTPGWAVYFASYEWLKLQGNKMDTICPVSEDKRMWRDFLWRLNAGGTAGVLSWIASLPQDVLKTKQQAFIGKEPLSFKAACAQIAREGGVRRLFKGAAPTFARGYLVNFVTLPMFDAISENLRSE